MNSFAPLDDNISFHFYFRVEIYSIWLRCMMFVHKLSNIFRFIYYLNHLKMLLSINVLILLNFCMLIVAYSLCFSPSTLRVNPKINKLSKCPCSNKNKFKIEIFSSSSFVVFLFSSSSASHVFIVFFTSFSSVFDYYKINILFFPSF